MNEYVCPRLDRGRGGRRGGGLRRGRGKNDELSSLI
jgi:hypothetical protein